MSSSRWIHNNVKRRRETLIIEFCPPEISKGYYYIYYFFKLKASCFSSLLYTKNETQNLNCKLSSLFNFLRTIIFLVPSMTDSYRSKYGLYSSPIDSNLSHSPKIPLHNSDQRVHKDCQKV